MATTGTSDLAFSLLYMRGGGPGTGRMEQGLYWRLRSPTNFLVNCSLDTAEQENYIVYNNVWKHNHDYNEFEKYLVGF